MKHLIQYASSISTTFYYYLNGKITLSVLVTQLKYIESIENDKLDKNEGESLWFRLFGNDTEATSISDIERDLRLPTTHPNYIAMKDKLRLSIELENEFQIYFS